MDKMRLGLTVEPWVESVLSGIAGEHGLRLSPPHAARAGREWDLSAVVTLLASEYGQDRARLIIDALDGEFGDRGGCRLNGDILELGRGPGAVRLQI